MKLLIGLGNPGTKYENTRHNIGFRVIDSLVSSHSLERTGTKFQSVAFKGQIAGESVVALKPETFMNLSGEAVLAAKQFYKIASFEILVIYDDFDLPFGTLRLRKNGSAGTHNGMKSIVELMGDQFPRLRFGLGPKPPEWNTADFVLSNFSSEEEKQLPKLIQASVEIAELWIKKGTDFAMSQATQIMKNKS